MKAQQRGFTLIELMIVVGIIGILMSIAWPAYTRYLVRGKIAEAHATLTTARVQFEQSYQDNRTYANAPCPAATTYFSYACTLAAATYTVTATNVAAQGLGAVGRYQYTINEGNTRATLAFWDGATSKNSTTTWLTK